MSGKTDSELKSSIDFEAIQKFIIQFQSHMSDPLLSDIDFKNNLARVWTTLNYLLTKSLGL